MIMLGTTADHRVCQKMLELCVLSSQEVVFLILFLLRHDIMYHW